MLPVRPTKPIISCGGEFVGEMFSLTVKEGENLNCSCSSFGMPAPNIMWMLPERTSNYSYSSVLVKENISRSDGKKYTCIASNKYGFHNQSVIDIRVQCKLFQSVDEYLNC